jgi:hypothetical protein
MNAHINHCHTYTLCPSAMLYTDHMCEAPKVCMHTSMSASAAHSASELPHPVRCGWVVPPTPHSNIHTLTPRR